jgi:glycosyltransferase involved in cell wall biosynthesis
MKGSDGNQKKELEKLVDWLQSEYRPELIHLNNCMFVGMAPEFKKRLNVPVVCSLTGEDLFLEDLQEPYKNEAIKLLQQHAQSVDGFIAPSSYYGQFMTNYLNVPKEKMHVVPLGLNLKGHGERYFDYHQDPFVLGYLARICPEKGFHVAAETFQILAKKYGRDKIRFHSAGYISKKDLAFFQNTIKQINDSGFDDSFEYWGEVDRNKKIEFLNSIHVLSVPAPYKEPKGLYILEALANGVPVVQPPHGSFPELIRATGGGVLAKSGSAQDIATAIEGFILDRMKIEELGHRGKVVVHAEFGDDLMADATLEVYRKFL